MDKRAFYFGCIGEKGHYLYNSRSRSIYRSRDLPELPWTEPQMDSSLLKNGKRPDIYDGKVFWTCAKGPWHAFVWWDNSVDDRGNSNSGFYVQGFEYNQYKEAFEFACTTFPNVVQRQRQPLVLQENSNFKQ